MQPVRPDSGGERPGGGDVKIIGWCIYCHKVKQVDAKVITPKGVQVGICDECVEKGRR